MIGEAATAAAARSRIAATIPDVVLLDVRLPDGSGIDVCRDVRSLNPQVKFLILTAYDDDAALSAAVIAGASGYVLKDVRGSRIVESVRSVAEGRSLLDPTLTRKVIERIHSRSDADPRLGSLTARETQILSLIAEGLTNRQIGAEISLAEKTVKNYVSGLLAKLGLQRRTQAAILHLGSHPAADD